MTQRRAFIESPQNQGEDEIIAWSFTTTPWGTSPSSISVAVKDMTWNGTDVTSTVMPVNSPSAVGDVITLSPLKLLTNGHRYRMEVKFTASGQTFESYLDVIGET